MLDGVLLAVQVGKIATRVDGSVSISLETQEMSPAKAGELFGLRNKTGFAYISPREISQTETKAIDGLAPEMTGGKSPSKRLRDVLYVAYKQNPEGYKDSETYYMAKMEKFIEHVKSKLEPR